MPEPRSFVRSAKVYRNNAVGNYMPTVKYGQWHRQDPVGELPVCGKDLSGDIEVLVTSREVKGLCKSCIRLEV
jgi:hypothetical protein